MAFAASSSAGSAGSSVSCSGSFTPSLVDSLFQRSLDDMIKALRSAPGGESSLLPRIIDEIRREVRSTDRDTKCLAIQKLTYLSSLHSLDMAWAAFHVLELLPSSSPAVKRSAYLSASLSFHSSSTDLLPLATHQLRKDLQSPNPFISSPALHLLSLSSSPDLALHLSNDLLSLISSTRAPAAIRCRAAATALPVLRLAPNSARGFIPELVEFLEPSSPLLSTTVGVFCELVSSGDPCPYLTLAPDFHRILLESRSNWVLIKILKIFTRLTPLEPRLGRKLVDPICELMRRSPSKSLVFECIRTVFSSLSEHETALRLAVEKVKDFVAADDDPNLRYLGLHALGLLGSNQSWALEENREAVVKSLADPDPNIRREALRLIMSMVFENNVMEISALLLNYALRSDPEFSNEILEAILLTCGRNFYELVMDFDWYVSLLGEMVRNPHFAKGDEIERQLIDIGLRVREARPELVRIARDLLIDPALLGNHFLHQVLSASAWISGEYIQFSRNPLEIAEALLQPRISLLPSQVRAVYIQAVFKLVAFCFVSFVNGEISSDSNCDAYENTGADSEGGDGEVECNPNSFVGSMGTKEHITSKSIIHMLNLVGTALNPLSECDEVEVQERARNALGLVHMLNGIEEWKTEVEGWKTHGRIREIVELMNSSFSEELGPVSTLAQMKISVPQELHLKENLSDLAEVLGSNDISLSLSVSFSLRKQGHFENKDESEPANESTSLLAEHRKRHGLYYLPTEPDENGSNEYPRANEFALSSNSSNTTEDLLKLTDHSLISRKMKSAKPRPTVVKLNEGDFLATTASKNANEAKEDVLSGAVKEVLLGSEEKPSSSGKTIPEEAIQMRLKETLIYSKFDSGSTEKSILVESKHRSSSSQKNNKNHGKERRRNSKKSEDKDGNSRSSARGSHHHARNKHKQSVELGDAALDVALPSLAIQDFLL
ncbi:AP-3 complex subunit delta [Apostasia shenzhenica]|uniref:AP-3 complex subunit delta n=1 Tax=Apostasia shenzhenica TaxID=1088818 RepID=A0A2I0B0X9_9ASPA|nr:AP-3 complex subunit delta [Apostasia shenzhenica]